MNADCWSVIAEFLSLKELINVRKISKEIHKGTKYKYDRERNNYIRKEKAAARRDWIHRSPILCCLTGELMTSRFGAVNRMWDPPLLWLNKYKSGHLNRNIFKLDENIWGDGSYIDNTYRHRWDKDLWYGRVKLMNMCNWLIDIRAPMRQPKRRIQKAERTVRKANMATVAATLRLRHLHLI